MIWEFYRKLKGCSSKSVVLVSEPNESGVFEVVASLATVLMKAQQPIVYLYSSQRISGKARSFIEKLNDDGVLTLDLRVRNAWSPAADLRAVFVLLLVRWVLGKDIVVHAHSFKAGLLARLAFISSSVKLFYSPHAYFSMAARKGWKAGLSSIVNIYERLFSSIGKTIAVGPGEAKFARMIGVKASRILQINNGIDTQRFRPLDADRQGEARRLLGLPDRSVPLLGTVARYSAQKDPWTLYKALALAMKTHHFHFLHYGQGEMQEEIHQFCIQEGVHQNFTWIPHSDEHEKGLACLDLYLSTSVYEGLSVALLEAFSTNLPVLKTKEDYDLGVFDLPLSSITYVATSDFRGLSKEICRFIDRRDEPREVNHRAQAEMKFDSSKNLHLYFDAYQLDTGVL